MIVVSVFLLVVFGVGGQRVEEEDPGDESVQDRGEQQRQHEEDAEIEKVNGQIKLSGYICSYVLFAHNLQKITFFR